MYNRLLNLPEKLAKQSHFLFGPRGVGKSTLIKQTLPDALIFDLLNADTFQRLVRKPSLLSEKREGQQIVVIDEIQKFPSLLDEVHRLIENESITFLLTGSSARKLKQDGVNLLAGRAFRAELLPLTSQEIPDFDLFKYINTTGLPAFYDSEDVDDFLESYIGTYLQQEIQAESLTRDLPGFVRFLDVLALNNGRELNYTAISSDTGVNHKTIRNYVEILHDTLLGFELLPMSRANSQKANAHAKFYWFDIGVVRYLTKRGLVAEGSELFGPVLEHFIALELRAYISYRKKRITLQYWRTKQNEVDFILDHELAVEVKSTDLVKDKHLKGLKALKEEGRIKQYYLVSMDPDDRKDKHDIYLTHWQTFLKKLWCGELF